MVPTPLLTEDIHRSDMAGQSDLIVGATVSLTPWPGRMGVQVAKLLSPLALTCSSFNTLNQALHWLMGSLTKAWLAAW